MIGAGATLAGISTPSFAHPGHHDQTRPIGAWTRMADMPFPIQEIYPAAHREYTAAPGSIKPITNTRLVNAGGLTDDPSFQHQVTDKVTIYDPATDQWSYGPNLPFPMHHVALVSNSGFLTAIGGFARDHNGGWQMQDRVWEINNLDQSFWQEVAPLPIPQAETVSVSLNGRIHVVGGRSPSGSLNRDWGDHIDTAKHWAFYANENEWVEMASLPEQRNSAAGAVYRGALYFIGGRTVSGGNSARVDIYDPISDRWQRAAPLPAPTRLGAPIGQGGLAAATWDGYIYAFGGEWFQSGGNAGGVYSEVWEYDPREDKWRAVAAMPRPRHGLGAVALQDGIYVLGGAARVGGNETSNVLDRFSI